LPDQGIDLDTFLSELEKSYVLRALQTNPIGNQTRAAELLGMSVRSLRHLLDKHSHSRNGQRVTSVRTLWRFHVESRAEANGMLIQQVAQAANRHTQQFPPLWSDYHWFVVTRAGHSFFQARSGMYPGRYPDPASRARLRFCQDCNLKPVQAV